MAQGQFLSWCFWVSLGQLIAMKWSERGLQSAGLRLLVSWSKQVSCCQWSVLPLPRRPLLLYASSHPGLRECPSALPCNPSTSFTVALLYRIVLQFSLLQRAVCSGLRPGLLCCVVTFYRSANFLSFLNVKIVKRKQKRQGWGVVTPQPIMHCVDKMQSKWV